MRPIIYIFFLIIIMSCNTRHLAVVKIDDKYGCINKKGEMVIQPIWDYVLQGYKKNQILVERDSLFGYINNKGDVIIIPQYYNANLFMGGLAAVSNGEKYGFINIIGDTILPFLYDNVDDGFSRGLCDVTINDSSGYINKKGEVIIPLMYNICYPFKYKYATVMTFDSDPIFILVDKKGKVYDYDKLGEKRKLYPPRYSYPGSIETNTGQGRVNKRGDTIVPPNYLVTGNLRNGMYTAKDKNGKWGAYNKKGQNTVAFEFSSLGHFSNGLAVFGINGKYGFINKKGQIIIEAKFDDLYTFSKGLAYAVVNNKVGYINKKGEFVIKPKYEPHRSGASFY